MKKITFLALFVILLIIIGNVGFSIVALWSKKDVLVQAKKQLVAGQKENAFLKQQWQKVQDPAFIEEQARDKLFLGNPGETIVVFPQATPSGSQKHVSVSLPPWQQWWDLFF